MKKTLLTLAAVAIAASAANAQISITTDGQTYTQNFNTLPTTGTANTWTDNSTITGWYANAEDLADGYIADNGSSTAGDVYSYGTTSSSDRALGFLGSGGNDYTNFGLRLVNNSGGTLTGFTLSFTGEQWRSGGNTSDNLNTLVFSYRTFGAGLGSLPASTSLSGWTADTSFDFSAPQPNVAAGALDGNLATNQESFSGSVSSITWNDGDELWLRWTGNDGSGTDAGLAIDNVSVTAVPEPHEYALGIAALLAVMAFVRRRSFVA